MVYMELIDLVKGSPNLKELFQKIQENKIELGAYLINGLEGLEILIAKEDYCVVRTHLPYGFVGDSRVLIHPYGASVGYEKRIHPERNEPSEKKNKTPPKSGKNE